MGGRGKGSVISVRATAHMSSHSLPLHCLVTGLLCAPASGGSSDQKRSPHLPPCALPCLASTVAA